ncbi:MAG TPA: transposase [Patescibacteria group bacterium]|nr:transposase [Patescibacteria group bacterium]
MAMARHARTTYPGAHYHITSRGNNKKTIFDNDNDRLLFLKLLGTAVLKFGWKCYAYCLMDNHFHLYIETPDDNVSVGMKHLNGQFASAMNKRYGRIGHVFQSRFHSIIIKDDQQRLNVARYVVLNPVRAGLVQNPKQWKWSSYNATAGFAKEPIWLLGKDIIRYFENNTKSAQQEYSQFILQGINGLSPLENAIKGML